MSAGKGSAPRNCFSKEFRNNYDRIFGKSRVEGRGSKASDPNPFAEINSEIRRIIAEEPDDEDRCQKLMRLSFAKAGRMIQVRNQKPSTLDPRPSTQPARTVTPHPEL